MNRPFLDPTKWEPLEFEGTEILLWLSAGEADVRKLVALRGKTWIEAHVPRQLIEDERAFREYVERLLPRMLDALEAQARKISDTKTKPKNDNGKTL